MRLGGPVPWLRTVCQPCPELSFLLASHLSSRFYTFWQEVHHPGHIAGVAGRSCPVINHYSPFGTRKGGLTPLRPSTQGRLTSINLINLAETAGIAPAGVMPNSETGEGREEAERPIIPYETGRTGTTLRIVVPLFHGRMYPTMRLIPY